jgi:hypothetical protein
MRRRFEVPDTRAFGIAGTARVDPNAPDPVLDSVLGTTAPGAEFTSSGHLQGALDARASRAFDGSDASMWTAPVGSQIGQRVGVDLAAPITVSHAEVGVVADGRHSVPTKLHVEADGRNVATIDVPATADGSDAGIVRIPVDFAPVTARSLQVVVDATRPASSDGVAVAGGEALPVALTEVAIPGVARPAAPSTVDERCRTDLVAVDGAPVPVRVTGAVADARSGLDVESCAGPLDLRAGSHTVTTGTGLDLGVDVDRLVLSSAAGGAATAVAPRGAPLDTAGATVRTVDSGSTSASVTVHTDGKPFWLVFGQSHNDGWKASTDGGSVGPQQLVDGYANGWVVRPDHAGTLTIHLTWTPQRLVWAGIAISVVVVVLCAALLVLGWRRRRQRRVVAPAADPEVDAPTLDLSFAYGGRTPDVVPALLTGIITGLGVGVVSRAWIGIVAGVAAVVVVLVPRARLVVELGAPLVLALSRVLDEPELAWLTIALLVVDLAARWVRGRARRASTPT